MCCAQLHWEKDTGKDVGHLPFLSQVENFLWFIHDSNVTARSFPFQALVSQLWTHLLRVWPLPTTPTASSDPPPSLPQHWLTLKDLPLPKPTGLRAFTLDCSLLDPPMSSPPFDLSLGLRVYLIIFLTLQLFLDSKILWAQLVLFFLTFPVVAQSLPKSRCSWNVWEIDETVCKRSNFLWCN